MANFISIIPSYNIHEKAFKTSSFISFSKVLTLSRSAISNFLYASVSSFSELIMASVSSLERIGLVTKRIFPPLEAKSLMPLILYDIQPVVKKPTPLSNLSAHFKHGKYNSSIKLSSDVSKHGFTFG